ncbi:protein kinase [Aliiglaciecola sp. 2_MG-2023]|uniref:protein kinase domain-containing protein n=1 Tax=unclassified Aliiglaciecola TaxID=2593648 RepID=UPI0026E1D4D7|nr:MULTISPECIES: protein kinase [unclassified Aliiglaciecola]MDO6711887.1 protein kinase [Aliiglaciecola sp. 2_MG-2023]MDO6753139.1 protein kinase [Aliiglaciecola sp. 1_MG-2023]
MENILALPIGTEINHYVIESVLGQGGFGVVYKAHHAHLNEQVVIKEFLPVELASRQGETVTPHGTSKQDVYGDCLRRFMEEGRTLVKLRHPNVVRCRDLFTSNGTAYLVMDFEDGLALDELISSLESQGQHYSQEQLMHFLLPLADGLAYIHSQGVLHRDIKPANIFIRRSDGSPVLIDFGAAKQNFALASQSQAPYTEFYAPMEQIEGGGEAKPTIDIHAFGALIYRIVTGEKGTKAESRTLAFAMGKPDPLIPAIELQKGEFSQSLLKLVDDCLQFRANDRPQTMQEVKDRLLKSANNSEDDSAQPLNLLAKLDDLIALAGSDGEISEAEMKLILDKAVMLTIDPVEAQQYVVSKATQHGWRFANGVEQTATEQPSATPIPTPSPTPPPPAPAPPKPTPTADPVWPANEKVESSGGLKWLALIIVLALVSGGSFYGYSLYEEKQQELAKQERYLKQKQRELDNQRQQQAEILAKQQAEQQKKEEDDQAWSAAVKLNSRSSYQHYLDVQTEGRYRTSAQNRIDQFERVAKQRQSESADKTAWNKAKEANTAMDYDGYLNTYPSGIYRSLAEAALRKLTNEGLNPADAEKQFVLGNNYRTGNDSDIPVSYEQSVYWYKRSADQDHANSANNLGYMYENGYGVSKSLTEAAKWYAKAANLGSKYGQNNLGILYRDGDGVKQSYSNALYWLRKSAEHDHSPALHNLGNLYRDGKGVTQSHTEAIKWYRKAADLGNASAQVSLGLQYERGDGVPVSNTDAVYWYRKAAEQGNQWGQYDLGLSYEFGRGVNTSLSTAIEWYKKAAKQGHEDSQKRLTDKGYTW